MMLGILRNVRRHPPHLHTPQALAQFSISIRVQNELKDIGHMQEILHSESRQAQLDAQRDRAKTLHSIGLDASAFGPKHTWKPFQELRFIRPSDLTYQSRLKPPPQNRRRPLVGPPQHVSRHTDMFHKLDLDPVRECTNHVLLSHFVTKMGRILGRKDTGLTTKSQRRLGKAIRRAKMMGIIPLLSNASIHPSARFSLQPGRRYHRREVR